MYITQFYCYNILKLNVGSTNSIESKKKREQALKFKIKWSKIKFNWSKSVVFSYNNVHYKFITYILLGMDSWGMDEYGSSIPSTEQHPVISKMRNPIVVPHDNNSNHL